MRKLLLIIALSCVPATSFAVGASWPLSDTPRFWLLGESNTHVSLDTSYFVTRENYNSMGVVEKPSALNTLSYTNAKFHVGHGFSPKVSLFAQFAGRGLFEKNNLRTNQSDVENYGLGDVFLGLRWLLYRSRSSDRVYPTEWTPNSWLAVVEGTWNFPLYAKTTQGKPPLGDQSNDYTALGRLAWYANEWLGLSGSVGYTYRSAGYSASMPWNLRADFSFMEKQKGWRFWADLESYEAMAKSPFTVNPTQLDFFPSGSLLFKSDAPTLRTVVLGAGFLLSQKWEMVAGGLFTASGIAAAKGMGGTLGVAYRPYQIPEIRYEQYRKEQISRLQTEPQSYKKKAVVHYGQSTTIIKVSGAGNYFKIAFGTQDGIKNGDNFQIFAQDMLDGEVRRPLATARVVMARPNDSFLRVEQKLNEDAVIQVGQEVRRVIIEE